MSISSSSFLHIDIGEEAKKSLTEHSKPYIISLSGLSLADNVDMLNKIYQDSEGIAAIELNLACPNIPGKPVVSNDFEQMEEVLKTITDLPKFKLLPLGIKLGPYFDMPFFERAADIIAQYPVRYVVSCNTIGNALFIDAENECEAMAANRGMGGLGGGFIKHTALANVRTLRELLDERGRADIDLVGVGGVATGRDAFELILCGAKAVQVGSCHWTEGPACFARIAQELTDLMRRKGYSSIEEFRGKLKPYIKPSRSTSKDTVTCALKSWLSDMNIGRKMKTTDIRVVVFLLTLVLVVLAIIIKISYECGQRSVIL